MSGRPHALSQRVRLGLRRRSIAPPGILRSPKLFDPVPRLLVVMPEQLSPEAEVMEPTAKDSERLVVSLHGRRGQDLYGFAVGLGLSDADAADAVQEAMLRLWRELGSGSELRDLDAWAFPDDLPSGHGSSPHPQQTCRPVESARRAWRTDTPRTQPTHRRTQHSGMRSTACRSGSERSSISATVPTCHSIKSAPFWASPPTRRAATAQSRCQPCAGASAGRSRDGHRSYRSSTPHQVAS